MACSTAHTYSLETLRELLLTGTKQRSYDKTQTLTLCIMPRNERNSPTAPG
jgi:hypothetical protein